MAKIKMKSHDDKYNSEIFGFDFFAKGSERDVMSLLIAATVSFAKEINMDEKDAIKCIKEYMKTIEKEGE